VGYSCDSGLGRDAGFLIKRVMRPISYCLALLLCALDTAKCGVAATGGEKAPLEAINADGNALLPPDSGGSSETTGGGTETAGDAGNAVRSSETDDWIRRSDQHLSNGRAAYFEGNMVTARREFDAAIDALLNAPDGLPDRRRIERRLAETSELIYRYDIDKLGASDATDAVVFDKAPIDEISHMTFEVDTKLAPKVSTELKQTQSGIPLELSDPVLSYIHFFSSDRGRATLLNGFRRAGRYKPLIQKILAEENVPQELIYLAQAESGFLPRAVSYKQAVGMWQFIEGTGSKYDLVRTSYFDERLDPEKATRAAARHLRDLYARYGDWYLAMAAYNCGAGNVDRAVERTGYSDYWELLKRNALPRETANYVPIILAMTIMAKNPQDYGLQAVEEESPVEYETLHLDTTTSLDLIADAAQQPVSVIRDLNPSFLRNVSPAGLSVKIPKGTSESAEAALQRVPAGNREAWRLHRVESGETLASIAQQYHSSPQRIHEANGLTDVLEMGETLLIPVTFHEQSEGVHARTKSGAGARYANNGHKSQSGSQAHIAASNAAAAHSLHVKAVTHSASAAH
jgi:membrane-bound lytic murein transglycosylase D